MIFCYFGGPRPPKHQNGRKIMKFHEIWWNLAKCCHFREISPFLRKGAPRAEMAPKYLWKRQGILGVLASRPERVPFSWKCSEIIKISENHDFHEISWNFMKFMISADFPEQRGPGPRPGPGPFLDTDGNSSSRAPPSRARGRESGPEPTGIRPRADGNPAPSRPKSCPDPDPLPPFKYLPYSLPVRVGRCASPPHSNIGHRPQLPPAVNPFPGLWTNCPELWINCPELWMNELPPAGN